ncbi:RNA polymerase sigma factor [Labilibaculum euxinus]|uniref:RNA polymerase sigma-70 factor n=1 Tax=Labilibaculum euxinus TaxID=2686357 RepID=A0A7M4D649_9BACT|nr:RNA polymerase sigma-70 factor [Labilibaculum euxinus]MUP38128.1 RNA polymerase sigma-70 factor [Labilibaculum euxinus]MVB07333.1 RNA polymerase sigma-70 factor [Labilibaculum euxinus]
MPESKDILNELLRTGSRKSYEAFFKKYYQDLFLWANSILKDSEAAEDIVQDFFVDFWEKKRFKSVTKNLQSYIFRSVRNSCLNYIKREQKLIHDIDHLEKEEAAPKANANTIENSQLIYSSINELPEKCREVFVLCCVHGYTYNEAAEELGVTINTVRTHMVRAFKFLREKLKSPHLFYLLFFHE